MDHPYKILIHFDRISKFPGIESDCLMLIHRKFSMNDERAPELVYQLNLFIE